MKTHFDYDLDSDYEIPDEAICGTVVGESYSHSSNWEHVNCKRCIKSRPLIELSIKEQEESAVEQLGLMAKPISSDSLIEGLVEKRELGEVFQLNYVNQA
ncbi:hypothetical protein [Vibrio cholerae]|uniref:hypothetical protein n=1 Tax=Vibrio cholerae TaxID=666 RepID=UPI00067FE6A6|nr:hypothetical protein [Vibrio cholerae]